MSDFLESLFRTIDADGDIITVAELQAHMEGNPQLAALTGLTLSADLHACDHNVCPHILSYK